MSKKRIFRITGIVIAIVVTLLFTSCFGIAMETMFNPDGSGRLTMKLRVAQFLLEMGEEEAGVGIPLSKDDLTAEYEEIDGVTVVEVTEEDTDEDRIITAIIDFENFTMLGFCAIDLISIIVSSGTSLFGFSEEMVSKTFYTSNWFSTAVKDVLRVFCSKLDLDIAILTTMLPLYSDRAIFLCKKWQMTELLPFHEKLKWHFENQQASIIWQY